MGRGGCARIRGHRPGSATRYGTFSAICCWKITVNTNAIHSCISLEGCGAVFLPEKKKFRFKLCKFRFTSWGWFFLPALRFSSSSPGRFSFIVPAWARGNFPLISPDFLFLFSLVEEWKLCIIPLLKTDLICFSSSADLRCTFPACWFRVTCNLH